MKKHDWFAANLFQPELSITDFYNAGITPNNTEIKSKDYYKSIPAVVDAFTENGTFNENKFEKFYNSALLTYNRYSSDEYEKHVLNEFDYDPAEWRKPIGSKKKDTTTYFQIGNHNLRQDAYGIENLGIKTSKNYSTREIAQMNKVRDANGNILDWTPNDKGGLFKSLTRPTLVLATYEQDTVENINGQQILHKKGELMLDDEGNPFYRELAPGESVYGKDVLHISDTLTDDDSEWNKYDFFDSDGVEKSVGGTIMKTAASILPYLIPGGKYVKAAKWTLAGVQASTEMAKVLPVLGKAVSGTFGGNEDNSAFYKNMTEWESYMSRFDSSTSDKTRNDLWTLETFGNLVSDITGQLFQQRAVSAVPSLLKKAGFLDGTMNNVKLGQEMALGYMAMTSARDTYSSFIEAGANNQTAGIATIASMLALNGLMRQDYFRKTLFKGSFFDEDNLKDVAKSVANEFRLDDMVEGTAKDKLLKMQKRFTSKFASVFSDYKGAMLREGLEEMMEEAVFDFSKGVAEGLQAIGVPVSNNRLDFKWDAKEMFSRYSMSFLGGALGGGIFNAAKDFQMRGQSDLIKSLDDSDLAKMTYLVAEGRSQELRDYVTKLYKKGLLGDSNLSGSKSQIVEGLDGEGNVVFEEGGETQNDLIYKQMMRHIDYLDNIISQEGLKIPNDVIASMAISGVDPKVQDKKLLTAQVLNLSMVRGGFLSDVNKLRSDIVKYRAELDSLMEPYRAKADGDKDKDGWKNDENIKNVQEKLNELREKRKAMFSGDLNSFYAERGMFALDNETNRNFINFSKETFTEVMKGKRYVDLSEKEKKEVDLDYEDYKNTALKRNIFRAYEVYNKLSELYATTLQQIGNSLDSLNDDNIHGSETNIAIYDGLVTEYNKKLERYKEFYSKENRTSEEEKEFKQLENEIIELRNKMGMIGSRPAELLRGRVENELHISQMLNPRIARYEDLIAVQNYLKFLYTQFNDKKVFVRSEDELDEYYRTLRALQNISVQDRLKSFFDDLMSVESSPFGDFPNDAGESFAVEIDGKIVNLLENASDGNFNGIQKEFINKVKDLEQTFGDAYTSKKIKDLLDFIQKYSRATAEQAQLLLNMLTTIRLNDSANNTQFVSLLDFRNEIETLRETLTFSPLNELLKTFQSEFGGDVTIADILNKELHNLASKPYMEEYVIGNAKVKDELKHTLQLLNAIRAIVNGAHSGLNEAGNKLRKGDSPKLAELSEKSAKMLMNDIIAMQNKIEVLLQLDINNSAQKLRIHKESEIKMKPMFVKYLIDSKNAFKDQFDIDIEALWNESDTDDVGYTNINDLNWSAFESTRVLFESKIHDAIIAKGYTDIAKRITAMFGEKIYKMESTRISTNTEVLTSYDVAEYLLDIVSIRCSDFTARYKEVLERRKTDGSPKLAPVVGQEFAIRRDVCQAATPTLYNDFLKEMKELAKNDPDNYVKNKRILENISLTLGGAGTGKTVAIGGISADIISFNDDVEFIFIASNDDQVSKLKTSVGHSGKTFISNPRKKNGKNNNVFDEYVEGKLPEPYYDEVENSLKFNPIILNQNKTLFDPSKSRKIIMVDEVTLLDVVKLQALVDMAKREGAVIWAFGDLKQNQAQTEVEFFKNDKGQMVKKSVLLSNGIEDFFVIKSPTLTTSLRSGNEAKFHNATELDNLLTNVLERVQSEEAYSEDDYDKITKQVNSETIQLYYYDDGDTLVGEKMIADNSGISAMLTRLAQKIYKEESDIKKRKGRIAYITDQDNVVVPTDTNPNLQGIVEHVKADQVQGGEYDYVIIDKKWPNSRWSAVRDFYTLTQRSIKGTVFVNNGISSLLNFNSISDASFVTDSRPSDKQIQQFINWKTAGLGAISMFGSISPYFKTIDKPIVTTPLPGPNDSKQQSPTATGTPIPEGAPTVPSVPQANGKGIGPFIEEEPFDFTDEGEPIYSGFQTEYMDDENPIEEPPYEPVDSETFHDEQDEEYDEIPNERDPFIAFTDEGVFEERFGNWDLSKRIDAEANFGIKIEDEKSANISKEDYETLFKQIPGLIKYLPRNEWKNAIQSLLWITEFKLNNFDIEIRIKDRDNKGEVYCVLKNHGTKEIITFPITIINAGNSGTYEGDFQLYEKGSFERGEWITLEDLKRKYPTLHIRENWGCISLSPKDIEDYKQAHALEFRDSQEAGEAFLEEWFNGTSARGGNNGKAMVLMTDNGYAMLHSGNAWNYGTVKDKKWMHSYANILTQVGIERPIDPAEFLNFLHYRHLRMERIQGDPVLIEGLPFEQRALATDETFLENDRKEGARAFHEQMRNRRFQILNYPTTCKLFNEIFNSIGLTTSPLSLLCFSGIKQTLNSGNAIEFANAEKELKYSLRKEQGLYVVTTTDVKNNTTTTETLKDFSQQSLYHFISENNASFVGILNNKGYWMHNNQLLYELFQKVIYSNNGAKLLNDFLANNKQFKHGLFPNVAGGNFYSSATGGSIYRKVIHRKDGWMTDASIWHHSVYTLDTNNIVRGDSSEIRMELDKSIQYEEDLEQIKNVLTGTIDVDSIESIKNKRPIEEIISEVNAKLGQTLEYPVSMLKVDQDKIILTKTNNINTWLQHVANAFGLDPNGVQKEFSFMNTCKSVIFSVNLHNYYRVCQNADGKWELFEFNSFHEFKNAYNNSVDDSNATTYLRESVSSTNKSTVDIGLLTEETSPELLNDINNYLLKRLENNEC